MTEHGAAGALAGRVAVVTGAASGIGRAIACTLAARGAQVVAAGLQGDELARTAAMINDDGATALAVETDVSDPGSVEALAQTVARELGGIDILVNNAAIYPYHPWHEADKAEWDSVFAVNVTGGFLCAKAARPQMIARGGGSIVNISSTSFIEGLPNCLAYVASKAAIVGFTQSLASEVGPEGIRVNAVLPGAQRTNAVAPFDPAVLWPLVRERQAIKRDSRLQDVADAVAFFASDESSFITGQVLPVDGGVVRR